MSTTARLNLPYIAPQQAQKQVTYNEAMAALDQLVQPAVKSRTTAVPPASPAPGDTYVVAPAATGAWSGKAGKFACWLNGAWSYRTPSDGWLAYVTDTAELAVFQSGTWTALVSLSPGQLAFPATQNPSANPNTLDDYEEGTWTPVLAFGGASTGITYGSPTLGRYTKIGRSVSISGTLVLTSKGTATGVATITGLPFTAANDGITASAAIGFASGMSGISGAVLATVPPNTSRLNLHNSANGAGTALTQSNFGNSAQLYFSATFDV